MDKTQQVIGDLNGFSELISEALLLMLGAMLVIVLFYKLVSKYLIPHTKYKRGLQVGFGALYAMVLVMAVLLALKSLGHDVTGLAGIAMLVVIIVAVLVFFLIPFLPVLPF